MDLGFDCFLYDVRRPACSLKNCQYGMFRQVNVSAKSRVKDIKCINKNSHCVQCTVYVGTICGVENKIVQYEDEQNCQMPNKTKNCVAHFSSHVLASSFL